MKPLNVATAHVTTTLCAIGLATGALASDPAGGATTDPVERYRAIFAQLDTDGSQSLSEQEAASAGLQGESFAGLDSNGERLLLPEAVPALPAEADSPADIPTPL